MTLAFRLVIDGALALGDPLADLCPDLFPVRRRHLRGRSRVQSFEEQSFELLFLPALTVVSDDRPYVFTRAAVVASGHQLLDEFLHRLRERNLHGLHRLRSPPLYLTRLNKPCQRLPSRFPLSTLELAQLRLDQPAG